MHCVAHNSSISTLTISTGIVFIDSSVDDYETLMAGVKPGLEVVLLDVNSDGIAQITQVLKGRRGLSSLHIVAHGSSGELWVGSGFVDSNTLEQYSDDLLSWAAALAPDADILLYGCNVAAGETGQQFVQLLGQLTGADVAASNNLTGSAALGGDWELEVKIGKVEAPIAFGAETMDAYCAVLTTRRVSVASNGTQGNGGSGLPSISADGRYVAFESDASNLVSGDTNNMSDIFVYDTVANTTRRVSVDSNGTQVNDNSYDPSISADGRYVAFYSSASNLVSGDTNGWRDIFVYDTVANTTRRVSVGDNSIQGNYNYGSLSPSISGNGRYVAFESDASNLVSGDTNRTRDIFVYDTVADSTRRISVDSNGTQGNNYSSSPSISADGRYVAFFSSASNLVSGDTNGYQDIFVYDTVANTTRRVSVDSNGTQGNYFSFSPSISADGRYVAFSSDASNLVSGDTNNRGDIFVYDTVANTTRRVSVDSNGTQGNNDSSGPSISADGRYVAFTSGASNLVSGDTNGVGDIFVYDTVANLTRRVSADSNGTQGIAYSSSPSISADGSYVAFYSSASNLVSGDTNGYGDIFVSNNDLAPKIPVAWWKLDGTTGTTAADSAGIKDGILLNSPTPIAGKVDNALSFDGVNDYVVIADNDALDFGTGDFAISTWIKTTDNQGVDVILDKRVLNAGAIQGYHLFNYDGKLGLQLADGLGWTNYVSNISVADGQWHQVSVSVDRDNANGGQWYIDGKLVETFNPTGRQGSLSNSQALNLGNRFDSAGGYFNGSLDEVKLFNNTLSATDVANLYQTDMKASFPNRVGWWKLDGTTGTTTADSAGTKDAILHNSPTPTVGKVDNGLSFDGVNDYVEVADNNALDFGTGDFSISTWIKTTDNLGVDVILDKRVLNTGATQGYHLFNYNGQVGLQLADGSGWTNYISNVSIADGQWHQVTVSVDRNNANGGQWYIDGNLAGTFNPTGQQGSLSNSQALMLGNRSDSAGGYFNGSLDEVQLFNKALSAIEVKAIFQNQPLAKAIGPDFNRDGKGDILWRNSATGQNSVWQMDGTNLTTGVALTPVADANWGISGTGDFNGDSKEDILWRHSVTGQNVVWLMDGTNSTTGVELTPVADANWGIGGTGDFNGDGKEDILWRNSSTGQNVVWLMDGTNLTTGVELTPVAGVNWGIGGTGDFNGDGKEDILWRNSATGQNVVWLMDGTQLTTGVELTPVADANWSIGGTGDYNQDGQVDILWRNGATGQNVAWLMNGTQLATGVTLTPVAGSDWQIVA